MENKSKEVSWVERGLKRFTDIGVVIPKLQTRAYTAIGKQYCTGRTVIDVGSSLGVGSNILSNYARFVWGIDMVEENVRFATQMFERDNLKFDVFDIEKFPTKEYSKFEVLVMLEVLEHLADPELGLMTIKEKFFNNTWGITGQHVKETDQPIYEQLRKPPKGADETVGFISVPNVQNPKIEAADSKNSLHINRWSPGEFYALMIKHFKNVTLYSADKINTFSQEETVDGNTMDRLIIAKVQGPII